MFLPLLCPVLCRVVRLIIFYSRREKGWDGTQIVEVLIMGQKCPPTMLALLNIL